MEDKGSIVLIPGIHYWHISEFQKNYLFNPFGSYYFYDVCCVNEEFFLKDNYLEGTAFYNG